MFRILFMLFALLLSPMSLAGSIDINAAAASELETLPGIGPSKAQAIVEYRTANGPFASVDALDDVPGIGPATLASLRDLVTVGQAVPAAATPPAPAETTSTPAPAPAPEVAATPAGASGLVNVNTATAAELDALPGIGPSKAAAIVEDRNTNGPFSSCQDLTRVTGIGAATVANLEGLCAVK